MTPKSPVPIDSAKVEDTGEPVAITNHPPLSETEDYRCGWHNGYAVARREIATRDATPIVDAAFKVWAIQQLIEEGWTTAGIEKQFAAAASTQREKKE